MASSPPKVRMKKGKLVPVSPSPPPVVTSPSTNVPISDVPTGRFQGPVPPPAPISPDLVVKNSNEQSSSPDIVVVLLLALIIVNGITTHLFTNIKGVITNQHSNPQATHNDFLVIGGELVAVVAVSIIASTGRSARNVMLALVLALWFLWGVKHASNIASFTSKIMPKNTTPTVNLPGTGGGGPPKL